MSVNAYGIQVGPLFIRFYGLLIVGGLILAAIVAAWMAKRDDRDPDDLWGGLTWALVPGIIGARLWYVLFPSEAAVERGFTTAWMLTHPLDLTNGPLAIWNGGLGIFGAVIGGVLGVWLYTRRHKLDFWAWMDIGAVVLPLGQAIGRWGNFINKELYGKPTTLPWGITIPASGRTGIYTNMLTYPASTRFHPIFLYESVWNALTMVILLFMWLNWRRRFKRGDFLLMYVVSYSTIRFLLEFLRVDSTLVGVVNVSQAFTAAAGLIALAVLFWRHRAGSSAPFYENNPGQHPESEEDTEDGPDQPQVEA